MKMNHDLYCKDPRTNFRLSIAILATYGILLGGFLVIIFGIYGITHLIIRWN